MKTLNAALMYREKGFSVIPIRQDKKPYIPWAEYQTRRATPEEIKGWWEKWPGANVAIATGELSGIFVIDCDDEEAYRKIQELLPDSLVTCVAKTPRGYHIYFLYQKERRIGNTTNIFPGVDIRGEGGYIIAPPSINGDGMAYDWLDGLSIHDEDPAPAPESLYNKIVPLYRDGNVPDITERYETLRNVTMSLNEGCRDEAMFHIANSLIKGGMTEVNTHYVLDVIAQNCNPPFPKNEIQTKIKSAIQRAKRKERKIQDEVKEWIDVTSGYWNVTECNQALQCVTKEEKAAVRVAVHRLHKSGLIERHGNRNGCYRRVENDADPVDFLNAPTEEFPIKWPFELEEQSIIYPGNIIVVAGAKSAGKTAFLLNVVRENMYRHEIDYLNSEMGDTEFRKRLEFFDIPLNKWRFNAYHRASNFADLITAEKKIFIVDFLEVTTDFWKVAQYIQEIHKKLKDGICIIALQKSDNKDMGRGGDFSKEKSRLYLSLDYLKEEKVNQIKIVDAKAWREDKNPRGLYRYYKLVKGCQFMPVMGWKE